MTAVACIAAYAVLSCAVAVILGRCLRHADQPQPWQCPDSVGDLFAEIGVDW